MVGEVRKWVEGLVRSQVPEQMWLTYPSPPTGGGESILQPGDYFRVRVHHINLAYDREWFTRYAPVLSVATQFQYGDESITRPAVIGPSVIEELGMAVPPVNTEIVGRVVAGPHPLTSPNLTVTMALQRVERSDLLEPFLKVIGGTANALSLTGGIQPFLTLANVVVDGISVLVGGDRPLMARQIHFSPVRTGHYAMVLPRNGGVERNSLLLFNDDLHQMVGGQLAPFRGADFVLYSVDRVALGDVKVDGLPFASRWKDIQVEAGNAVLDEQWLNTKTKLLELEGTMRASPDLTERHKRELTNYWRAEAKRLRESAVSMLADLGGSPAEAKPIDDYARRALAVLEL